MKIKLIVTMALCLIIVLPIVGCVIHIIDQRDRIRDNSGAAIYVKKAKRRPWIKVYLILSKFFFTQGYIDKISRRYEILCPGDFGKIAEKTMNTVLLSWFCCSLEIFIIFIIKPNLHNSILAIILIFVINNEIINYRVSNLEIKLLEEMANFISDVRHNYHINRMVDDAILLSMEDISYEMKLHAQKLYEITLSNNLKEDVSRYNAAANNKYLKTFLALCISVIEFNDKKINGQQLFTINLQHLKREIHIEILKRRKLKHVFSGTVFVTMAVCVPIDAIQSFGLSIVPELDRFYFGQVGMLYVGVILLSAVIVYLMINNMKEIKRFIPKNYWYLERIESLRFIKNALDNYFEKYYSKTLRLKETLKRVGETITPRQLLLKRMLAATITFFIGIGLIFYIHINNRQNILNKVTNIRVITTITAAKQLELAEDIILQTVRELKKEKVTQDFILQKLMKEKQIHNSHFAEELSLEITNRIKHYQEEYFHWNELLFCIFVSGIAYYIPFWLILYQKRLLHMNMEDEINQFHSIIYMMMYIDHMTVKNLMEQLELFAVVFKPAIQECINDYNSGETEALLNLKEKEPYGPFRRLVDNLIRCDRISIDKAFDDIASDRENYHDRRKQENEISINKRMDIVKPLSFIPAVLVTIYLLLPLLYASLKELEGFRESMSTLGF
ncbi:MAG: hypothetical protein K0S76_2287 [Herbinix sp.]|jgi:hypothetical protein|nr:hypothetical protein [Herbinix sp.]